MGNGIHQKIANRFRASAVPLVILIVLFILLAVWVVSPLVKALVWSGFLSFITYPAYKFLYYRVFKGRFSSIAAGMNTFLILFLLVIPMIAIGFMAITEGLKLYSLLASWLPIVSKIGTYDFFWNLPLGKKIIEIFPSVRELPWLGDFFGSAIRWSATTLTQLSKEVLGNLMSILFTFVVIMVSTFFMTRDGHIFLKFLKDIVPLSENRKDALFLRAQRMIQAVLFGVILTAGIQGFLGGLGWWFCGLDSPVFFGALMFLFATIPFMGTPAIWGPGVLYLFFHNSDPKNAVILLLWGLMVVSSIDNFIRPIFISEGSKAHILLVFIGIIGGMLVWGILGLFIGPLILALCVDLLDGYRKVVRAKNEEVLLELAQKDSEEESVQG